MFVIQIWKKIIEVLIGYVLNAFSLTQMGCLHLTVRVGHIHPQGLQPILC